MSLLSNLVPNLTRPATAEPASVLKPVYAVREDTGAYELTVQLPGVDKSGLEITAQENEINVTGRRNWAPPAEWTAVYRETPRADFGLTLRHGGEIDAEKIGAELKDGVLRLTLPKAEAVKPRKIAVN